MEMGYVSDDDVEYVQQEQTVQTKIDSADEHTQSGGVPDLQQSPAVGSMQADSQADSSAVGYATPPHSVPVFNDSTPSSAKSSEPVRFRDLN
jgi:hypothetical protein